MRAARDLAGRDQSSTNGRRVCRLVESANSRVFLRLAPRRFGARVENVVGKSNRFLLLLTLAVGRHLLDSVLASSWLSTGSSTPTGRRRTRDNAMRCPPGCEKKATNRPRDPHSPTTRARSKERFLLLVGARSTARASESRAGPMCHRRLRYKCLWRRCAVGGANVPCTNQRFFPESGARFGGVDSACAIVRKVEASRALR
jgi:hypothetical protein